MRAHRSADPSTPASPATVAPPAPEPPRPAWPPLTHHEILQLTAPFSRQGRAPDMAATDRAQRTLAFRAVHHPGADGAPAVDDTLVLAPTRRGLWRLTRTLVPAAPAMAEAAVAGTPGGAGLAEGALARAAVPPPATVTAEGLDPAALLARVLVLPAHAPFVRGPGYAIAHSWDAGPGAGPGAEAGAPDGLTLTRIEARLALPATAPAGVPALRLELLPPRVRGVAGQVELRAEVDPTQPGTPPLPALPDDVLGVLGRGWSPLDRWRQGWRGTLRLRGATRLRTERAQREFERAARHLAQTLAEPPPRFHARHRGARWATAARRALPVALLVGVCALALGVQQRLDSEPVLRLLVNLAPPLMLGMFFAMPEMPRVALPRPPWPLRRASWWSAP